MLTSDSGTSSRGSLNGPSDALAAQRVRPVEDHEVDAGVGRGRHRRASSWTCTCRTGRPRPAGRRPARRGPRGPPRDGARLSPYRLTMGSFVASSLPEATFSPAAAVDARPCSGENRRTTFTSFARSASTERRPSPVTDAACAMSPTFRPRRTPPLSSSIWSIPALVIPAGPVPLAVGAVEGARPAPAGCSRRRRRGSGPTAKPAARRRALTGCRARARPRRRTRGGRRRSRCSRGWDGRGW